MNNKTLGSGFESELCSILADNNFWAYNTVNKASGQPVDIIACKNNCCVIMDAKVCSNDYFPLSRVESNQDLSIRRYADCGNWHSYFAFKFNDDSICIVDASLIIMQMNMCKTRLTKSQLFVMGDSLEGWLSRW